MRVSRGARFVPAAGLAVALALGGGAAQPPAATAAAKSCPSFSIRFPGKTASARVTTKVQRGSLSCRGQRSIGRRFYRNWSDAARPGVEYARVGAGWRCAGASGGGIGICKKGRVRVYISTKG